MRLTLVHLSDIHFRQQPNRVAGRVDPLVSAIISTDPTTAIILIVVSGDIAFSAQSAEYQHAHSFLADLRNRLQASRIGLRVDILTVPGNHDCFLPETQSNLRDILTGGFIRTINEPRQDQEVLKQILEVQSAYNTFRSSLESGSDGWNGLWEQRLIEHGGHRLQCNLYNTALLSRRDEQQGTLYVPAESFVEHINIDDSSSLSISVFHHSYLWLEANNALKFRGHIERTSDVALMGHQHYHHTYYKVNETGEKILYMEGAALQDEFAPQASAFDVLVFDLATREEQSFTFKWSKNMYVSSSTPWRPLSSNKAIRRIYRVSKNTDVFLSQLEQPITHVIKGPLQLRDIFVYPQVAVQRLDSNGDKTIGEIVGGDDLLKWVKLHPRIVVQGGPLSGRTSLAKVLFADLLASGDMVPLILDGPDIKSRPEPQWVESIWRSFAAQYDQSMLDSFKQLSKERRVLIIDNWHKCSLNPRGRAAYLTAVLAYFDRAIIFADPLLKFRDVTESTAVIYADFVYVTLSGFRHELRGRLIDKWMMLGGVAPSSESARELEETDRVLLSVIRKNTLPSSPFIILCLLQAMQEEKIQSAEAGSFGYLYEVLVTTTLNSSITGRPQLEKKYVLLARLAFEMFKRDLTSLSKSRVHKIAAEYSKSHLVRIDIEGLLTDLVASRALAEVEGNYEFGDSYLFYYFIARYYRDNLERPGGDLLREDINNMVRKVGVEKYARILIFILYFARNTQATVSLLVSCANEIFEELGPTDLDSDVAFLGEIEIPEFPLPEHVDTAKYRTERRKAMDRAEQEAESHNEARRDITYSDRLSVGEKMILGFTYIELLGQVIRNFPASLPGPEKVSILECTYSLGLRMMRAVLTGIREAAEKLKQASEKNYDSDPHQATQIREMHDRAAKMLKHLSQLLSILLIKGISSSVGLADLEDAYAVTLGNLGRTPATNLVDIAIRLDHMRGFPESDIKELHRSFVDKPFADKILINIVVLHRLMFDVDNRTRQGMEKELSLKRIPELLSSKYKQD